MFENSSVFVMVDDGNVNKVYKLEIDADSQKKICGIFETAATEIISKTAIEFNGSYKPEKEEVLCINGFTLTDDLKDALRSPIDMESFTPDKNSISFVKAIFVGECTETSEGEKFCVAFQKFKKDQYFSTGKFCLIFNGETFVEDKKITIAVSNDIDCVFENDKLFFNSFYYARQVFDLSQYYRTATDADIDLLLKNQKLNFKGREDSFKANAKTWLRRKIALINDSGVLNEYTAEQIKALAKQVGIDVSVENDKIVIPEEKEKFEIIFRFLDEEAYKGPFSGNVLIANSKRTASATNA